MVPVPASVTRPAVYRLTAPARRAAAVQHGDEIEAVDEVAPVARNAAAAAAAAREAFRERVNVVKARVDAKRRQLRAVGIISCAALIAWFLVVLAARRRRRFTRKAGAFGAS